MSRSNPSSSFATGGGGYLFEHEVQASYVVLMLAGGYAPCLPCWPIVKVKFQNGIYGVQTDDIAVYIESPTDKEQRKLLAQIKTSTKFTPKNSEFRKTIQRAWYDFNDPKIFTQGKDFLALITKKISYDAQHKLDWLLDHARAADNAGDFFGRVKGGASSPSKIEEKLQIIEEHIKKANNGKAISKNKLYRFLKSFYLLRYDLGSDSSVVFPLLNTIISQYQNQNPEDTLARIIHIVARKNSVSGTLTRDDLPEDILSVFKKKSMLQIPAKSTTPQPIQKTNWVQHSDARYLALVTLIGAWDDNNEYDCKIISQFLGVDYKTWLSKAGQISQIPGSPLKFKNGTWSVVNRIEFWNSLGTQIFNHNLDTLKSIAIKVLKEPDPAFDLPADKRYMAIVHGKTLNYSQTLRKGIAEGLAILGNNSNVCDKCPQGKIKETTTLVLREIFTEADYKIWGSLNDVLPALAEADPDEFFRMTEKALHLESRPFVELFAQEHHGYFNQNYLTGLLWALERLAWEDEYVTRVCTTLGELASHDPDGRWKNRTLNSLAHILFPWSPQTLASVNTRKGAVTNLIEEFPDIAWNLIVMLLPEQHVMSFSSQKPIWRDTIPDSWDGSIPVEEYKQLSLFYANIAVDFVKRDNTRILTLIDHFDSMPNQSFEKLIKFLDAKNILKLSKRKQLLIWENLIKFTNKHRRYSDAVWVADPSLIDHFEKVAEQITPQDPIDRYRHLFSRHNSDLYEKNCDWEEQDEKLTMKRKKAIDEIFDQHKIRGIIRFFESVDSPWRVGDTLGRIPNVAFEKKFLPHFLDVADNKRKDLVRRFIRVRYDIKGWEWCDNINKSSWTLAQITNFLTSLPFTKETWDRAYKWLKRNQGKYWSCVDVNVSEAGENLTTAIEKLNKYDRPYSVINFLNRMQQIKQQPINTDKYIHALLAAPTSKEPISRLMGSNTLVEVIEFIQSEPSFNEEDVFKVEWAYFPIFYPYSNARPKFIEHKLANSPETFCEAIKLAYRSTKEKQPNKRFTKKEEERMQHVWRLLHEWKTLPGTNLDKKFNAKHFNDWIQEVERLCTESGHLNVAFTAIGRVLVYAPKGTGQLWIHDSVAKVLNVRHHQKMREGFYSGAISSRGVYKIDPEGKPEKELAKKYMEKAQSVEKAGYPYFAVTLRELAKRYEHEAAKIISEYGDD